MAKGALPKMSSEQKAKTNYFTDKGEHESLSIESLDNGHCRIKFYTLKVAVNPIRFMEKVNLIEKQLNQNKWYIEGRLNKDLIDPSSDVAGEVAEKSTSSKPLLTCKGDNIDQVVTKYIAKRKELDPNHEGEVSK